MTRPHFAKIGRHYSAMAPAAVLVVRIEQAIARGEGNLQIMRSLGLPYETVYGVRKHLDKIASSFLVDDPVEDDGDYRRVS